MTYVIAEPCVNTKDTACVDVCPVDCIAADPSVDRKFYIDPAGCIDCGSCEAACPNGAIYREDLLPESWALYARVDAVWFGDPARARTAVEQLAPAAAMPTGNTFSPACSSVIVFSKRYLALSFDMCAFWRRSIVCSGPFSSRAS